MAMYMMFMMSMMRMGAVSTVKGVISAATLTSASVSDITDLFVSGNSSQPWSKDLGQVCYRIPSLVKLGSSNTLVAIASERLWEYSGQSYCSDESATNLVMRRSVDGGLTWSNMSVIVPTGTHEAEMTGWTIYDEIKEKLFVFTNLNVSGQCTCDVGFVTSSDGGLSWTDLAPANTDTSVDNGGFFGMGLTANARHHSLKRAPRRVPAQDLPQQLPRG